MYAPYQIVEERTGRLLLEGGSLPRTRVSQHRGELVLGERTLGTEGVKVVSQEDGALELNGVRYRGEVFLTRGPAGALSVSEGLDVERYLQGVLGSEMPDSWEEEALRAQAICARTYIVYQKEQPLDALHLAYIGTFKETQKLNRIVADTKGIVMLYQKRPFPAYFHSTCGGHTEDVALVFKNQGIPPLRGVRCGFCNGSKYYQWETQMKKEDLERRLQSAYPRVKDISSIMPIGPGRHGSEVEIRYAGGNLVMNANEFRLLLGPNSLFSTAFSTQDNGTTLKFSGKGWGHGVGLCQYGAQKMAETGYRWHEILRYYYPGVELARVYP